MSSPRITKDLREKIVTEALRHTYYDRSLELLLEENTLAGEVYEAILSPSNVKAMRALQSKCVAHLGVYTKMFNTTNYLYVQSNGCYHNLRFFDTKVIKGKEIKDYVFSLAVNGTTYNGSRIKYEVFQLVPSSLPDGNRWRAPKGLSDVTFEFMQKQEDFKKEVERTRIMLNSLIESVSSFKKLRSVWPEGEIFYNIYDVDTETKPNVPAPIIAELNKILKLP